MPDVTPYKSKRKNDGTWWRARLNLGTDPITGKYRRPSVIIQAATQKKAMQQAVILESQKAAELENPGDHFTFADIAELWWTHNRKGLVAATRRAYRYQLDLWILDDLGPYPINAVTRPVVRRWLDNVPEGLTNATRNRHYSIVRSIMHYAADYGYVDTNPLTEMPRLPTSSPETRMPSIAEVAATLQWLEDRGRIMEAAALFVLPFTGLRRGELYALRWQDIDFDTGAISIRHALNPDRTLKPTKTRQARTIKVPPIVIDRFARLAQHQHDILTAAKPTQAWPLADPDWHIWWSVTDGPHRPADSNLITRWLKKAGDDLGYRINPHSLRHLTGSLVAKALGPAAGAGQLGHSSPAVTMAHYIHADADQADANRDLLAQALHELE